MCTSSHNYEARVLHSSCAWELEGAHSQRVDHGILRMGLSGEGHLPVNRNSTCCPKTVKGALYRSIWKRRKNGDQDI